MLNNLKIFQSILYRFHFLYRWMFPRLFQFLYRIRSIIHWQSELPLYLFTSAIYYAVVFWWESNTTVSTFLVLGNISTAAQRSGTYPASPNRFTSRASVPGSQETYTIRSGPMAAAATTASSRKPFRGGSTTITCGRRPSR